VLSQPELKGCHRQVRHNARWRADPASDGQLRMLRELGVALPAGASKGTASALIDEAMKRPATGEQRAELAVRREGLGGRRGGCSHGLWRERRDACTRQGVVPRASLMVAFLPTSSTSRQGRGIPWREPLTAAYATSLLRGGSGGGGGAAARPRVGGGDSGAGLAWWLERLPGDEPASDKQLAFILKRHASSPPWVARVMRVGAVREADIKALTKRRASELIRRLLPPKKSAAL
jgi:hypothetical protein